MRFSGLENVSRFPLIEFFFFFFLPGISPLEYCVVVFSNYTVFYVGLQLF